MQLICIFSRSISFQLTSVRADTDALDVELVCPPPPESDAFVCALLSDGEVTRHLPHLRAQWTMEQVWRQRATESERAVSETKSC